MLVQTLTKIGGLLALGFGEAGSEIISKNITDNGSEFTPSIQGQKVICIFGFCYIKHFTEATEVLQEGIMLFVNEICQLVHGIVYKYSGAANKTGKTGDSLLLVWKFDQASTRVNYLTDQLELMPSYQVS